MEKLVLSLEHEASGKAHCRGIHEKLPDLQTFEIFLSKTIVQNYKNHFMLQVVNQLQSEAQKQTVQQSAVAQAFSFDAVIPPGCNLENLNGIRQNMNKLMMKYVEKVKASHTESIMERSMF